MQWANTLNNPALDKRKTVLTIDGPVKSGKTTFSQTVLPTVLPHVIQTTHFYAMRQIFVVNDVQNKIKVGGDTDWLNSIGSRRRNVWDVSTTW